MNAESSTEIQKTTETVLVGSSAITPQSIVTAHRGEFGSEEFVLNSRDLPAMMLQLMSGGYDQCYGRGYHEVSTACYKVGEDQ